MLNSGPYVEIDMRSGADDGYDAIALSPHKFLGGPGSPGILLMSKALYKLKDSPPSTCGGGTVNFVNCFNEKVRTSLENWPFWHWFVNLVAKKGRFCCLYSVSNVNDIEIQSNPFHSFDIIIGHTVC